MLPGQELDSEPRARLPSLLVAVVAGLGLVALMSVEGHPSLSVPLGLLLTLAASIGLLHGLGFFAKGGPVARSASTRELALPLAAALGSVLSLVVALRLAVRGSLPMPALSAAALVTIASLGCVLSLGWCCDRARIDPAAPPFWRRHGVWLLGIAVVVYVPMLGNYSLYDPWETHYGEVAREMLAREDWISFWWAQENWFWSKPALDFWIQGLSFLLLGVRYRPDEMLAGVADGLAPAPEWAARAPVLLLTLVANYLLYKSVARFLGRRAGFLAGLALTLTPYWYLIAHQSMTDMPYVAPLTAALALLLIGLDLAPRARVALIGVRVGSRELRFGKHHVVLLLVLASAIPQIAYLLSRHLSWSLVGASHFLRVHADQFMAGSGGDNCGLPGNDPCEASSAVMPELAPGLMALLWTAALGAFLWLNREESRAQRWAFLGAWYFVALSALGKGAPGLVLPIVVVVTALVALRRLRDLERLEWGGLALIVACVTLPWYVQAFARHGTGFTDRLLFYDMYKRAFVHVHDTNAGDDVSFRYYIWQLGYGLFPFTGIALWGFLQSFASRPEPEAKTRQVLTFLGIWSLLGFAMFSVSLTKFHHYALPVAPAAAALAGILLNEFLGDSRAENPRQALVRYGAATAAAALALAATLWLGQGSWLGVRSEPSAVKATLGSLAFVAAVVCFGVSLRFGGPLSAPVTSSRSAALGLFALFAAATALCVGHDLFSDGAVPGQVRLVNLFSYNYSRPWPISLDFEPVFRAVSYVAAIFLGLMLLPRLRTHATIAFGATCFCFALFNLDIYMVRAAPHWGQRETIATYYATRSGPEEPLVAYQMNWKGENFYTGNHIPAFVSTGQKFRDWVSEQRATGTRVMYFTTEHSRMSTLKNELGRVKSFQVLTKEELNNKFFLARVEL